MTRGAGKLEYRIAVRSEAKPLQPIDDCVDRRVRRTFPIGIFDPQQHLATGVAGVEPIEKRRASAADVQIAGWRGCEAGYNGCGHGRE